MEAWVLKREKVLKSQALEYLNRLDCGHLDLSRQKRRGLRVGATVLLYLGGTWRGVVTSAGDIIVGVGLRVIGWRREL